jgi:hypothetical protein
MYQRTLKMQKAALAIVVAGLLASVGAGSAFADAKDDLKCNRTLLKSAQKYASSVANELRKCNDALLKEGSLPAGCPAADPKGKAAGKIASAVTKATDKITDTCATSALEANFPENLGLLPNCPRAGCTATIDDESDLAACFICNVDKILETAFDGGNSAGIYGSIEAGSADKDALKCQRAVGKELAQVLRKNSKVQLKCEDAHLKDGTSGTSACPGSDPKGKAAGKIASVISKADGKISDKCPSTAGLDDDDLFTSYGSLADAPERVSTIAENIASIAVNRPRCGDAIIDNGETCDDGNNYGDEGTGPLDLCPADCAVGPCTASGSQSATVSFAGPAPDLIGATVLLYYDDTLVEIFGNGAGTDQSGMTALGGFAPSVQATDADYAVRLIWNDSALIGVPSGSDIVNISFDACVGAPAPTPGDFTCIVVDAVDNTFATRDDITCAVAVP